MSQPEVNCAIPDDQNSERSLKHLAAASHLYGHAKVIAGWQFAFSVPFPLAMSLVALHWPVAGIVTTPLSLLFGWLDILCLDRVQGDRKKIAARMQEQFDCELFGLAWNSIRCGSRPDTEQLNEAADAFLRKHAKTKKRSWYPIQVGRVPLPLARLICQRASVWWDMAQRQKYAGWLAAIVALLVITVIGISFTTDERVREMVLSVYLPIAPAVVWTVRECIRQRDAVAGLERVKAIIEQIYADAICGRTPFTELDRVSRDIQDVIFDGRARNPLFFDFLYQRLRPGHELRMNEKAAEMVQEALAKKERWRL